MIRIFCITLLIALTGIATAQETRTAIQAKPLPQKSCDEIVSNYQKSCLKACETYKETRKTQCQAACNDSGQLRLRKIQCEAGRNT
jgi:hypothetical protein